MEANNKQIATKVTIPFRIIRTKTMVLTSVHKMCIVVFVGISRYIKETLKQIDDVCYDRIKVDPELVWGCEDKCNERHFAFEDESSIDHPHIPPLNPSPKCIRSETFPEINSAIDKIWRKSDRKTCYLKSLSQNYILLFKTFAIICLFEISRVIRETLEQIDDACYDRGEIQADLWQPQRTIKKFRMSSLTTRPQTSQKYRNTILERSNQIPSDTFSINKDRDATKISSTTLDSEIFHSRRNIQSLNGSMSAGKHQRMSMDLYFYRVSRARKFKQYNNTLTVEPFSSNDTASLRRRSLKVIIEEDENHNNWNER